MLPSPTAEPIAAMMKTVLFENRPRSIGARVWDMPLPCHTAARRGTPYLTAPAVRPLTMYFCSQRKSTITGMAASTAPAAKTG